MTSGWRKRGYGRIKPMSHIEVLKQALEALEFIPRSGSMLGSQAEAKRLEAIATIKEELEVQQLSGSCLCGKQTISWCMANTCSKAEQGRSPEKQSADRVEPVAMVVSTAPNRIWLDLGFDPLWEGDLHFSNLECVTWSDDNATGNGIEYIRADISSPPPVPEAHKRPVPQEHKPLTDDTKRLDALTENSWDLRCFDMPTWQSDADIGWRVIEHHMAKPNERVIAEVYCDDPRQAIDRAIEAAHGIKGEA